MGSFELSNLTVEKKAEDFAGLSGERRLNEEQQDYIRRLQEFANLHGNQLEVIKPGVQLSDFQASNESEQMLQRFVASPMIKDSFGIDNTSRRKWEKEHLFKEGNELIEIYRNNKLAKARSCNIVDNFPIIYEVEENFSVDIVSEIEKILDSLRSDISSPEYQKIDESEQFKTDDVYDRLPLDQKMKFMDRYEKAALEILALIKRNNEKQL